MTPSKTAISAPLHALQLAVLALLCVFAGILPASAITYPPSSSFLWGNSAVNNIGQSSYVAGPGGTGTPYRYFVPHNYVSGTHYPVVIFMHGLGEGGTDNVAPLAANGDANGALALVSSASPNNQDTYPCFLVIPQSGTPGAGWWGNTNIPGLQAIINTLNTYYTIDTSRVSLTGLSAGGIGTWNIIEWPGGTTAGTYIPPGAPMFSCGVPLSASADDVKQFPPLCPTWTFHAANDPLKGVGGEDDAVAYLRNRGLSAVYTRYNTGGHSTSTWEAAYQNSLLLPWMLAQKVGQPMSGVFNMALTGASQGTTLSLSGTASTTPGFNRIGYTTNFVPPGSVTPPDPYGLLYSSGFGDGTASGTTLTTTTTTFSPTIVGYRLGLTYTLTTYSAQEYFDVVAYNGPHSITLNAAPAAGFGFCEYYAPGANLINPVPGSGTGPTWSVSGIPLSYGYNAIQVIAEAPSNGVHSNGGLTSVNLPYGTSYTSASSSTTPAIGITSPTITGGTYSTSSALSVSGTASVSGTTITAVYWATNLGYSGTASGTTSWSISNVPLVAGNNEVTVYAMDGNANTGSVSFTVIYSGTSANQAPIVNAFQPTVINGGVDYNPYPSYQTITWPTNSVNLQGSVTDDGLPSGASLTYSWTKLSGPGSVSFGSSSSLSTSATFSGPGTYVLQLAASDTALYGTSTVTVTVLSNGSYVTAIDCGSTAHTGSDGTSYLADPNTSTGTNTNVPILIYGLGTNDNTIYSSVRVATSSAGLVYNFTGLTNGNYDVDLKFAEPSTVNVPGMRVFNIVMQGSTVASNVDILARTIDVYTDWDEAVAYDHVIPSVAVTSGSLNITLSNVVGYPVLSAILIRNAVGGSGTAPTITGTPTSPVNAGASYSFTFTATGSPTPTFSITSGALPPGLTLGSSTGTISGTATSTDSGPYVAVATATNSAGSASTSAFTIAVNHSPTITNTATGTGTVGSAYNFTYTKTGYPTPTFSVTSGSLPSGLSLSTAGVITGTPAAAGTSTGVVSATNGIGSAATSGFTIVVGGGTSAPTITGTAPGGTVSSAYSYSYTVTGSPTPTCTVTSGSLPTGLSLSTNGTISGTPSVAGTSTGVITATNGVGSPATKSFNIVIASSGSGLRVYFNFEAFNTPTAPGGNWNTVYASSGTNTGGTSTTSKDFNTGASTGVGVTLSSFTYSQIYGVDSTALYPSPIQKYAFATTGTATVSVSGLNPSATYTLTIFGSSTAVQTGSGNYTIGSTTLSLAIYNNTSNTVAFTNVSPDGSGNVLLTVAKGTMSNFNDIGALQIVANSTGTAPTISGTAPGGTVGSAYSYSYTVTGSPTPTCSVTSGSLPAGLSLSSAGVISGTPSAAGTSNGVITAANGVGSPATKSFSIVIVSPLNVYFNFEPNGTSTAPGGNWNTVYGATGNTSGTSTTSKDFNTGASTGVGVSLSSFTYASWYGKVSTALYTSPVQTYSFAIGNGAGSGSVTISGLDNTKTYSVTVFGSDTNGRGATFNSTYTIGSTTLNYVNTNNTTSTAVFSSVTPDGTGHIALSVNAGTDHIGSLGALLIHQN